MTVECIGGPLDGVREHVEITGSAWTDGVLIERDGRRELYEPRTGPIHMRWEEQERGAARVYPRRA